MADLARAAASRLLAIVAVPAFNAAATIGRVLDSIEASVLLCGPRGRVGPDRFAIVVVDDASSDDAATPVQAFIARSPVPCAYLRQPENRGAGPARNRAAATVDARYLFFCDADDGFLPDHLPVCLETMSRRPELAAVATRLALSDPVHPDWHERMNNSAVTVLCVRGVVHQLTGGFDEHPAYRVTGGEDGFYRQRLQAGFRIEKLARETVPYVRRPGNNYDKQYQRFQIAPDAGIDADTPAQKELLPLVHGIQKGRIARLHQRLQEIRAIVARPNEEGTPP